MTDSAHPRRFAALDLGSLTVRLAVAERTPSGEIRVLRHRREITGLGQGLALTGELAPEGMARTLAALKDFQEVMAAQQVTFYRAVGTQALRQARNRQVFLDQVRDSLGLTVEVLAPEAEARLSLAGVLTTLAPDVIAAPEVLVFDVGGGSSEFALSAPGPGTGLRQPAPGGPDPEPGPPFRRSADALEGGGPERRTGHPVEFFL